MVVQISGLNQLLGPGVETGKSGLAIHRAVHIPAQAAVAVQRQKIGLYPVGIAGPDLRAAFQPALEVAAPDHLLHELFGVFRPVRRQSCRHGVSFQHQPAPDVGRQHRHRRMAARPMIGIATVRITSPHAGREGRQLFLTLCAGRDPVSHGVPTSIFSCEVASQRGTSTPPDVRVTISVDHLAQS